jgi:hypothetical protein
MHTCAPDQADMVIDGRYYRFDKQADFKRFCNRRLKGLKLISPIQTESRLKHEANEIWWDAIEQKKLSETVGTQHPESETSNSESEKGT